MVMFDANNRSINAAGIGTMITRTLATMPIGRIRSWIRAQEPGAAGCGTAADDILCGARFGTRQMTMKRGDLCLSCPLAVGA